jgi:hypothetical protein
MENERQSRRINKRENWQFVFKMRQSEGRKDYIFRFYVNADRTKIKKSRTRKNTIIVCPIKLDYLICDYLREPNTHFLVTTRLLEVINNMFDRCSNKCPYWHIWIQKLEDRRIELNRKGFIDVTDIGPDFIKTHDSIFNLYTAKDW